MISVLPQSKPSFMDQWPTAYPRARGAWTVADAKLGWGELDPESGQHRVVEPGQDQELPALKRALGLGTLIGYRVGRRAVVQRQGTFVKVVRPKQLQGLLMVHEFVSDSCPLVSFPQVVGSGSPGWVELSRVSGRPLHRLLTEEKAPSDMNRQLTMIARALAWLHGSVSGRGLALREPDHPLRWVDTVARAEPEARSELAEIAAGLPELPKVELGVVHRDLHDKNIFVSEDSVALIDLDGVGLGAGEDDVANLGVHLQLRVLQMGGDPRLGQLRVRCLYDAYESVRPLSADRLRAAEVHTWFRLACIYRFRASGRRLVPELLRRARP